MKRVPLILPTVDAKSTIVSLLPCVLEIRQGLLDTGETIKFTRLYGLAPTDVVSSPSYQLGGSVSAPTTLWEQGYVVIDVPGTYLIEKTVTVALVGLSLIEQRTSPDVEQPDGVV